MRHGGFADFLFQTQVVVSNAPLPPAQERPLSGEARSSLSTTLPFRLQLSAKHNRTRRAQGPIHTQAKTVGTCDEPVCSFMTPTTLNEAVVTTTSVSATPSLTFQSQPQAWVPSTSAPGVNVVTNTRWHEVGRTGVQMRMADSGREGGRSCRAPESCVCSQLPPDPG